MGHYPTDYDGVEHLKNHFRDQLDRLLEMMPLAPGKQAAEPEPAPTARKGWWQTLLARIRG